ncbi:MAG: ADOP family duplicated permease [Terriglobia bacterium]
MSWRRELAKLGALFRRSKPVDDLEEEIRAHLEIEEQENQESGMTRDAAHYAALRRFGNVTLAQERSREMWGWSSVETLGQDLRYGLHMALKWRGLTAILALTLALGIGANAAIFSLVNGFLLRPLPVAEPERIAVLAIQQKDAPVGSSGFSYPEFVDFRNQSDAFSALFGVALGNVELNVNDRSDQCAANYVSRDFFSALGILPAVGRFILPSEGEARGEEPLVVLGYSYWRERFDGDAGVVGKHVLVDGRHATIVGVVPREFHGMFSIFDTDVYLPYSALGQEASPNLVWNSRDQRRLLVFGRLKPGTSFSQAQTRVDVILQRLADQYPATDKWMSVRVLPEKACRPIPYANRFFTMAAAWFLVLAALVLLLACLNVENIMLARGTSRQREMGIRTALGAGRSRLIGQMLTESLVLAGMAGGAGLILGYWASRLVGLIRPSGMPLHLDISFDWRVLAYSLVLALTSGILVGLLPALHACSTETNSLLHRGGQGSSAATSLPRARNLLVVAQLAGSLALLVVAGLFVRSLRSAQRLDLGFDPDHVLNVTLDPSRISYNPARATEFYRALEARVRALPGVRSASLASSVPMGPFPGSALVSIEGYPLLPGRASPRIGFNRIDPPYFDTMGIPLLRGRAFAESDNETSARVAIINQTMAGAFWPHEDPIGKRFSVEGTTGPFIEVVGMVRNAKYRIVSEEPDPYFYVPLAQDFSFRRVLQIRAIVPPESLVGSVKAEISRLAPNLTIIDLRTMKESLEGALGFFIFRLAATFASVIGVVGLILAMVGVYGVVSFVAAQRTREIGIRMALGANSRDILTLVWKQGVRLVVAGVAFGLAPAWGLARALGHLLVGISTTDPLTYFSAGLLMSGVGLVACWIPARRAMKVAPMVALRYE